MCRSHHDFCVRFLHVSRTMWVLLVWGLVRVLYAKTEARCVATDRTWLCDCFYRRWNQDHIGERDWLTREFAYVGWHLQLILNHEGILLCVVVCWLRIPAHWEITEKWLRKHDKVKGKWWMWKFSRSKAPWCWKFYIHWISTRIQVETWFYKSSEFQ